MCRGFLYGKDSYPAQVTGILQVAGVPSPDVLSAVNSTINSAPSGGVTASWVIDALAIFGAVVIQSP